MHSFDGDDGEYRQCPCMRFSVIGAVSLVWVFVVSGFNVGRAIDTYQDGYAHLYRCPYPTKSGSCSEAFRNGGLPALLAKCARHRAEEQTSRHRSGTAGNASSN